MKKAEQSESNLTWKRKEPTKPITGIPVQSNPKQFTNTNSSNNMNFTALEKSPQELRMEQMEKERELKAVQKTNNGWLGKNQPTKPTTES